MRRLEGLARRQPVVMIVEDAHWIDPTSRELLELTVERIRALPVLLIVTFRPEFQPSWTGAIGLFWSSRSPAARRCLARSSSRSPIAPTGCRCLPRN